MPEDTGATRPDANEIVMRACAPVMTRYELFIQHLRAQTRTTNSEIEAANIRAAAELTRISFGF